MSTAPFRTFPLGFPWATRDPFLFCVHHLDAYPAGNERLGPAKSLAGRELGIDFQGLDGWRMYHGETVPGFPQHPHRGFETVTVVRQGLIDHSDSLGATARYGAGDVQWLTAGAGIVHSEMFPLLERERPNPLELFQIWLNLPAASKMVSPHFTMAWSAAIPRFSVGDDPARPVRVTLSAGALAGQRAPAPPPDSWAARPSSDVVIATLELEAGAAWTLPPASDARTHRTLYFFSGRELAVGDELLAQNCGIEVPADQRLHLEATSGAAQVLLLQGRPIGEPVAQQGPFVMNTPREIQQAFTDYQRTRFGGWPWPDDAPVHARDAGRFARPADGRVEQAPADAKAPAA